MVKKLFIRYSWVVPIRYSMCASAPTAQGAQQIPPCAISSPAKAHGLLWGQAMRIHLF
jgi:hypothetical protein